MLLQFAQTLWALCWGMLCYVMALPRRDRLHPAAVYWFALAPLSVFAGAEMFKLMAAALHLPFAMPVVVWTETPLKALSIIGACGLVGLTGILGLTKFARGCLRGAKRPRPTAPHKP